LWNSELQNALSGDPDDPTRNLRGKKRTRRSESPSPEEEEDMLC